jgi:hypothetical protein
VPGPGCRRPPASWTPEPSWPDPHDGWELWIPADVDPGTVAPAVADAPEPPLPRKGVCQILCVSGCDGGAVAQPYTDGSGNTRIAVR